MPDADDGSQAASSDIFPDADADVANGDAAGSEGNAMADGRRPGDVIVVVLNHTGQKGIAGAETDKLEAAGYSTLPAANAASSSGSGIYYETGYEVEAETLAKTLGLSTTGLVRPMSDSGAPVASERDVSAANLVVVLGRDGFLPAT